MEEGSPSSPDPRGGCPLQGCGGDHQSGDGAMGEGRGCGTPQPGPPFLPGQGGVSGPGQAWLSEKLPPQVPCDARVGRALGGGGSALARPPSNGTSRTVYTAAVRRESKGAGMRPPCWGRSTLRLEAIEKPGLQAAGRALRGPGSPGSSRSLRLQRSTSAFPPTCRGLSILGSGRTSSLGEAKFHPLRRPRVL